MSRSSPVVLEGSTHAMEQCVSMATCCTRWVWYVFSWMKSAAANPASTFPSSEWTSATTLFSGREIRAVSPSFSP